MKNHVNISSRVLSPLLNTVSLPKDFDETRSDNTFIDDSFSIVVIDLISTDRNRHGDSVCVK